MKLSEEVCWGMLRHNYRMRVEKKVKHTERVLRSCMKIAEKMGEKTTVDLDEDLLAQAAILHDIAKFNGEGTHHTEGEKVLAKEYERLTGRSLDKGTREKLAAVIAAHKGDFDPPKKVKFEAAVLRMADKLDKYTRGKPSADESYEKSMKKIKKYFENSGDYQTFAEICEKRREKLKEKREKND